MPNKYNRPYYNSTNTCDRCKNKLIPGHPYREYNKNGDWTGKWLCSNCYGIEYKKRSESMTGIIKDARDFRNGNLDPESTSGKGYIFEQITCKARGVKNLNIENDNFHSKIDHSIDSELGIIQSKGATYSRLYGIWTIGLKNERKKEFDYLLVYCMDEYMNNVERVYIFPRYEILKRTKIGISKNSLKGLNWYEKYRQDDADKYNDVYHNLDEKDLRALRKV